MIQLLSKVHIIDNSGGSIGRCIKILNPHGRDYAKLGDIILISVIELASTTSGGGPSKDKSNMSTGSKTRTTVTKGSMYKAVIVRTNKSTPKRGKTTFEDNAVVLLKSAQGISKSNNIAELTPIGSRIKGPISSWLANDSNYAKYQKVLSLTKHHY